MKINYKENNIAAVSLIEIMMIFAIIGIVSTACMGLAKPKYDYMTKIKIYSAYEMLSRAGSIIASEGHIDYTTDINLLISRGSNTYDGKYPNFNNQLPKVIARAASNSSYADTGINNSLYSSLNNTAKSQFKYLQEGLCQRLVHAFALPYANSACPNSIDATTLIDDSTLGYANGSFNGKTPLIYLPNGQVIYLSQHLYNDFQDDNLNYKKSIVVADPKTPKKSKNNNYGYNDLTTIEDQIASKNSSYFTLFGKSNFNSTGIPDTNKIMYLPNETRLAAIKYLLSTTPSSSTYNNSLLKYMAQVWTKNKDYFNIYVDINCKMTEGFEKQCGPDELNKDIFLFKMYRDGTVIPDYRSGFPLKYLTAKIMAKDNNDTRGKYKNYSNLIPNAYAIKPVVFSICYANLAGSYGLSYTKDHTGICTYGISGSATNALKPLSNCLTPIGETKCKMILNKPSFLMR